MGLEDSVGERGNVPSLRVLEQRWGGRGLLPHPPSPSLARQQGGPTCVLWSFLNPDEGSAGTSEALTAYLQGETGQPALGTTARAGTGVFWEGEQRMCTKNGIFLGKIGLFSPGMPH